MTSRACRALAGVVIACVLLAACAPKPAPAPSPSGPGCHGAWWEPIAEKELRAYIGTAPYERFMTVIFPRESGCDPCAVYPSQHTCARPWPSTALGIPQLLGKDGALHAACPWMVTTAWKSPTCQLIVTKWIYMDSGFAAWGG